MAFPLLYRRSIYFEIRKVNKYGGPGIIEESMVFTIPPTSIEKVQQQRITVTPTPGGNFIDNYGLGNSTITINGETGNDDDRLTVVGRFQTPRLYSGQEAWFEWRNRIERYSAKNENFIMNFYDLTHQESSSVFIPVGTRTKYTEAWQVALKESASLRNSQKPFFYPYRIILEGVKPLGVYDPSLSLKVLKFLSDVSEFINTVSAAIQVAVALFEELLSEAYQYVDQITSIVNTISSFESSLSGFSDAFTEYQNKLANDVSSLVSISGDTFSTGIQEVSFPYESLVTAQTDLNSLTEQTIALADEARTDGIAVTNPYDWDEEQNVIASIEENNIEIQDAFNSIIVTAKQDSSNEPIGAVAINGVLTDIYGYNMIAIKDNTRLDQIATELFGDPNIKDVISSINQVYSNDELVVGNELLIPVLEPTTRNSNIAVYNTPTERGDLLGRDAEVIDGEIQVTERDYVLITKDDNIAQAVDFRLQEKKGRQIRNGNYGIIAEVGEALGGEASFDLLNVSLSETLLQDPRITSVYDLKFLADGDTIYQSFKFDTITKNTVEYRGEI